MSGILILAVGLLVASATFSGAEAALFTLASQRDERRPSVADRLLADQPGALSVILLLNLIVNLAFFATAQVWARGMDTTAEAFASLGSVFLIVVVGEILPKLLAHRFPRAIGRALLPPVWLGHLALAPALRPLGRGFEANTGARPLDSAQTRSLLQEEARLADDESLLVRQVLELGQLRAGALRSPLHEVERVPASTPTDAAIAQLAEGGHAWAAVCGERGEVLGILDRLRVNAGATVEESMQPVSVLPEVAPVANGVRLLRDSGAPFVLLVDEYGDAAGIIRRGRWADALLDRLPASHRPGATILQQRPDGGWLADAALPLHVFEDRFGFQPESDVRVDTLGGLVAELLERVPTVGDTIDFDYQDQRCVVTVLRADETRPLELELHFEAILAESEEEDPR